jgi:hypothetical protein
VIVALRERVKELSSGYKLRAIEQMGLQEEFMIDSYGTCDSTLTQTKEAKLAELEARFLETFKLLEKLKSE